MSMRVVSEITSPERLTLAVNDMARMLTLLRRIQADLDRMEPILERLEQLVFALGTHIGLPGNGCEDSCYCGASIAPHAYGDAVCTAANG